MVSALPSTSAPARSIPHTGVLCALGIALVSAAGIVACGGDRGWKEVTAKRRLSQPLRVPPGPVTSAQRFGFEPLNATVHQTAEQERKPFVWDVPAMWSRGPDRPMRIVTFAVGRSGKTECYVSTLTGAARGGAANINRWRFQMNREPLSDEAVATLPQIEVLGHPAALVEVADDDGNLLLGVVCEIEDRTVIVKMTGPEAEVRQEADRFTAFCRSLRPATPTGANGKDAALTISGAAR